jgi:hypothetical protein
MSGKRSTAIRDVYYLVASATLSHRMKNRKIERGRN